MSGIWNLLLLVVQKDKTPKIATSVRKCGTNPSSKVNAPFRSSLLNMNRPGGGSVSQGLDSF